MRKHFLPFVVLDEFIRADFDVPGVGRGRERDRQQTQPVNRRNPEFRT
jgi:hypothetical protein